MRKTRADSLLAVIPGSGFFGVWRRCRFFRRVLAPVFPAFAEEFNGVLSPV